MNHFASKFVVVAQDNLMQARDERVSLMNEARLSHKHLKISLLTSCFICIIRFLEAFECLRHVETVASISATLTIVVVYGLGTQIPTPSAKNQREGIEISKTELHYRGSPGFKVR